MKTLHIDQLKALRPCSEGKLTPFGKRKRLNIREAFERGYTVSDICWLLGRLQRYKDIKAFAKFCAVTWPTSQVVRYAAYAYADAAAYAAADAADAADAYADAGYAGYAGYAEVRSIQKAFLVELLS